MKTLPHSTADTTDNRALREASRQPRPRSLDSSRIMQPPQARASELRRQRWSRRRESGRLLAPLGTPTDSGYVRPVRPARCSWTIGQSVGIMDDGTRPAGYTGIERCGSVWACPHCGAVIRAGRAAEIEHAATAHQKNGGELLFFTGTARHHQGDDLATILGALAAAWRKMVGNRPWKRWKKELGISGYIRATEITYGTNGWHPHAHILLFLDEKISTEKVAEFRAWLLDAWATAVEKAGGKRPTANGLDLQRVDKKGKVLARYLSKVQDQDKKKWHVGAEMARGDLKKTREKTSLSPFDLLDADSDIPEKTRGKLWREYYTATKGRRALSWSRGLKDRYAVDEREDEDILDDAESTTLVWRTSARSYRAARHIAPDDRLLVLALEHAEAKNWRKLATILPPDEPPPTDF